MAAICGTAPAVSAVPAVETGAVFTFDAEVGAHPVGDRSGGVVGAATWSGPDFIRVELNGAGGAPLTTGYYPGARNRGVCRSSRTGSAAGDHYGDPAGPALHGSIQFAA